MPTARVLLLLIAVAVAPGSAFPQRSLGVERVGAYHLANPRLAPWRDRLALFDGYASPWFGAIYLLLLIPRLRENAAAPYRRPPPAPRHLSGLPAYAGVLSASGRDRRSHERPSFPTHSPEPPPIPAEPFPQSPLHLVKGR